MNSPNLEIIKLWTTFFSDGLPLVSIIIEVLHESLVFIAKKRKHFEIFFSLSIDLFLKSLTDYSQFGDFCRLRILKSTKVVDN